MGRGLYNYLTKILYISWLKLSLDFFEGRQQLPPFFGVNFHHFSRLLQHHIRLMTFFFAQLNHMVKVSSSSSLLCFFLIFYLQQELKKLKVSPLILPKKIKLKKYYILVYILLFQLLNTEIHTFLDLILVMPRSSLFSICFSSFTVRELKDSPNKFLQIQILIETIFFNLLVIMPYIIMMKRKYVNVDESWNQ